MTYTVTYDLTEFEAFEDNLFQVIEEESIPQVAKTNIRRIQELTGQGVDAFGEVFHDYNRRYAKLLGIPLQPKTLRRDKGRLYDLELRDGEYVTIVDDDFQGAALGQMTGHGGDWGYAHEFLTVSRDTLDISEKELAEYLAERLLG